MTGAIVLAGIPTLALQISQIEFDLYLPAGTTGNYAFRVVNNETRAQEVKVYLSDWLRTPTGENDFIPLNGARWLVPRTLRAGEKLEIVYRIKRLSADITVTGSYVTGSPASRGEVTGARRLSPAEIEKPALSTVEGIVRITREIATASPTGDSVTVRVSVHVLQDVAGLRIDEVFSSHVDIEALESAGGTFDAVGRSNGDWIDVSVLLIWYPVSRAAREIALVARIVPCPPTPLKTRLYFMGRPPLLLQLDKSGRIHRTLHMYRRS